MAALAAAVCLSNSFYAEQGIIVFGFIHEWQRSRPCTSHISSIMPNEIIAICFLYYQQTEGFHRASSNVSITSSGHAARCRDVATLHSIHDGYVCGAFELNAQSVSHRKLVWKLQIVKACRMRLGLTADRHDVDTVLHVNGGHRYHTLSYLGLIQSHRRQQSVNVTDSYQTYRKGLFADNYEVIITVDTQQSSIRFTVNNATGETVVDTEAERINLGDKYKLVVYMNDFELLTYDYQTDGSVSPSSCKGSVLMLDFQMLE